MEAVEQDLQSSVIVSLLGRFSASQWLGISVATATVLLVLRVIYSLYLHPLASYPGPWLARSGLPIGWCFINGLKGRSLWALEEAHDKYGTWVRIGYNELSTLDGKAVNVLYSASSKWKKTTFYQGFREPGGVDNMFSAIDPHEHSYRRRIASNAFTMTSLLTLEPRVQKQATSLVTMLEENFAETGETCDMAHILLLMAADVVGALCFGNDDGFGLVQSLAEQSDMLDGAQMNNDLGHRVGTNRYFGPKIWHGLGSMLPAPQWMQKVNAIAEQNVTDRRKRPDEAQSSGLDKTSVEEIDLDMITYWLKTKDPVSGEYLNDTQIVRNALVMLIAGSDTTATTMRALFMYVLTTPGVKKKLVAELDEAFEGGACSWPPRHNETNALPYFQGCVKEALRMWPAVGWLMAREAPPGGASIGDHFLPAGTSVGIPAPHYHRKAEFAFGERPDEYNPERWIGGTDTQRRLREANLLSFGGGTRTCIGKNVSLLEVSISFAMLFRKFDFELIPRRAEDGPADRFGKGSEHHNWKVFSTWFAVQSDMKVKIKKRKLEAEAVGV